MDATLAISGDLSSAGDERPTGAPLGHGRLLCAMVAIGVALIVQAIAGTGSAVSVRLLLGVLFIAGGLARLYSSKRLGACANEHAPPATATPTPGRSRGGRRRGGRSAEARARVGRCVAAHALGSPLLFSIVYTLAGQRALLRARGRSPATRSG